MEKSLKTLKNNKDNKLLTAFLYNYEIPVIQERVKMEIGFLLPIISAPNKSS